MGGGIEFPRTGSGHEYSWTGMHSLQTLTTQCGAIKFIASGRRSDPVKHSVRDDSILKSLTSLASAVGTRYE